MNAHPVPVLIFLIPFAASFLIPFFRKWRPGMAFLASAAVLASLYFSVQGLLLVREGAVLRHYMGGWIPPYGIEWYFDGLTAVVSVLINAVAAFVILGSRKLADRELLGSRVPFYMVALLHIAGLHGMILTHDFFNLFVFLEVASLTAYALVATGDKYRGNMAGLRYLLIGTVGASFYLIGVGYLYAGTGTLNMTDMAGRVALISESRTALLGIFFILVGLAIKAGLFPFHAWMPDAYAYASDTASSFLAPMTTKVAIYSLIRILYWGLERETLMQLNIFKILMIFGTAALVAGSVMAFLQSDFKRMLAYSSVSQIGLIILAVGLKEPAAFVGAVLHMVFHSVMKASLFLTAGSFYDVFKVRNLFDLAKTRKGMPWTLAAFILAALSMIGIPPLAGFFSKWYILVGSWNAGQPWIAAAVVLSSLLTGLYFFKVLEQAAFRPAPEAGTATESLSVLTVSCVLLSIGLIVLGILSPAIYRWGAQYLTAGAF